MTAPRQPKKSETLEVRLPHAAKVAFMEHCRSQGVTASEVVRAMIESGGQPQRRPAARTWSAVAAAVAGLVIGAAAAPSIAQALPGSRAAFQHIDANHDGVITLGEFEAR